jgi:hypothetical protein
LHRAVSRTSSARDGLLSFSDMLIFMPIHRAESALKVAGRYFGRLF